MTSVAELIKILSLVPNVEKLALYIALYEDDTLKEMSSDADLNLHQVKKLNVACDSPEIFAVLNRLPVGVLQEVELQYVNLNAATILFKERQTNIKKLILLKYRVPIVDLFDNLKLESLELRYNLCKKFSKSLVEAKKIEIFNAL